MQFTQNENKINKPTLLFVNPSKKLRVEVRHLSEHLSSFAKIIIMTPKEPKDKPKNAEIIVYPSFFIPKIRYTIPNFIKQAAILKKIVNKYDVKLIHVFSYFYPSVWIPIYYSHQKKIPLVVTTDSFPGISWNYGSKIVDLFAKMYSKTLGKFLLQYSDKITLLHTKIKKDAISLGVPDFKLITIPNGIDLDKFTPKLEKKKVKENLGMKNDEVMLLNVGRLVPVKGIERLILLAQLLKNSTFKARMIIVGDGPLSYEKKYKRIVKNLKLDNIVFTGYRNDIPDLMAACDIFIFLCFLV